MGLEFRLLGPVGLWVDGRRVPLGAAESAKPRCVLAVLLRTPGTPVATDALVERVWGDRPPSAAVRYKYVGWLRSALAPYGVGVAHRDEGYLLAVEPGQVDLHRFRELSARAAKAAGDSPAAALRLWDEALGLWHGPAVAGLPGSWAAVFRDQLERERRDARVRWAHLALETGQHAEAARRLAEWETEYVLDEEVVALRMTALHRAGRVAEALVCYERAERRLREELDEAPGPGLRAARHRLRSREAAAAPVPVLAGPARIRAAATDRPVPRQLPSVTRHFIGRARELAILDALLDSPDLPGGTVVISAIGGSAGIGKTALALYWAHRVAARFPDGQLFVNLRGFDPGGQPVTPEEALRGFLGALGVEADRMPAEPQAQTALYRSLLAGRRVLVVLDNARGAEQVRPLLPGSSTCQVVVTSRDVLTGLVATEGAHPIALDLLTTGEAHDLLTRRLGERRIAENASAAAELVGLCARLPLALHIAAARAAIRPARPLTAFVAELRDARRRLDALRGRDPASDLRAVFSWSYQTLSGPAARMFRLLGLHPGPDITLPAAVSLTGTSRAEAGGALEELIESHLLTEHAAGRFTFHDLLRAYAAEQSRVNETDAQRHEAVRRVLDHYLYTARAAALLLHPPREPVAPAAWDDVPPEELDDAAQALDWFEAEHAVLLTVIAEAADRGFDTHARRTPRTPGAAGRGGAGSGGGSAAPTSLAAARRTGHPHEQARVHSGLGLVLIRCDRPDDAEAHLRRALELYRSLDDLAGQSHAHGALARLCGQGGRDAEALEHARAALELCERLGQPVARARALVAVARYHALLGDHRAAVAGGELSVAAYRELGDRQGQAGAWDGLGHIHLHHGDPDRARHCYRRALELYREGDDRYLEARTLVHLGHAHHRAGDPGRAQGVWRDALAVLDDLSAAHSAAIRAQLDALGEQ